MSRVGIATFATAPREARVDSSRTANPRRRRTRTPKSERVKMVTISDGLQRPPRRRLCGVASASAARPHSRARAACAPIPRVLRSLPRVERARPRRARHPRAPSRGFLDRSRASRRRNAVVFANKAFAKESRRSRFLRDARMVSRSRATVEGAMGLSIDRRDRGAAGTTMGTTRERSWTRVGSTRG